MQLRRSVFCVVVALGGLVLARSDAGAAETLPARLASALGRTSKGLKLSAAIWDAATGTVLHQQDAATPRRPASVTKLATTAAAFAALGGDHELTTEAFVTSKPDAGGVVQGSLIVRGHGDPGFAQHLDPRGAETALRDFAKQVRAAGVRRVTGDLVLDATAFPGAERHPSWGWSDGEWGWDQAPVSALVLNDSCVDLRLRTGPGVGAPTMLSVWPATQAVSFANKVATSAPKSKVVVVVGRTQPDGRIAVTGTAPASAEPVEVKDQACVDPVLFFGDVLRRLLHEEGVHVEGALVPVRSPGSTGDGPRVGGTATGLVRVALHATQLRAVAQIANTHSQNLYAELLSREVGRTRVGDGSFAGGCRAVTEALGFGPSDPAFHLSDGCGLSRENKMSAEAVGKILLAVQRAPYAKEFMLTLARPGEEGTLQKRFREAKFRDRVLAKTGTLRDTKALAGFVLGKSNRQYAFAILCEGDNQRAVEIQDAVVEALVDE